MVAFGSVPFACSAQGSFSFCTLCLTSFLIILIGVSYYWGENMPEFAFNRHACSGDQRQLDYEKMKRLDEPQCFNAWINADVDQVSRRFQKLVDINKVWNGHTLECETSYMTIGNSRFAHHIPHFAEVYFGYFSSVLWQHRVFQHIQRNGSIQEGSVHQHANLDLYNWQHSCIHELLVGDESSFWTTPLTSHTWMRNLVDVVDQHWNIQTVQSPGCIADKTHSIVPRAVTSHARQQSWFLHPSDSLLLSSIVLNQDPCLFHHKAESILSEPLQMAVIGRTGTRKVLNSVAVIEFLRPLTFHQSQLSNDSQHSSSNRGIHHGENNRRTVAPTRTPQHVHIFTHWYSDYPHRVKDHGIGSQQSKVSRNLRVEDHLQNQLSHSGDSAIHFEQLTFRQQVALMHSLDVAITVHGAGETNIAFMRPCSIVVEVFPHGFYIPDYFGSLAKQSGVLHYSWQESFENTLRHKGFKENPICKEIVMDLLKGKVNGQTATKKDVVSSVELPLNGADELSAACFQDMNCRPCTREADGVTIDVNKLKMVLDKAVLDREECIRNSPYYR
jgi:hypothetical protein